MSLARRPALTCQELDVMSIKLLKMQYMEGINEKRWDMLADCLAADASVAYENGRYCYEGRDAILEYLRESLGHLDAVHAASNGHIARESSTRASGLWDLRYQWHDPYDDTFLCGSGGYSDRYALIDGRWRITFTGFVLRA
jgi:hypothetical protein